MASLKRTLAPSVAVILGLVGLVWGIGQLTSQGSNCGEEMRQGDQCVVITNGHTETRSIEVRHGAPWAQGITGIGVDGFVFRGGAYTAFRQLKPKSTESKRNRMLAEAPSTGPAMARYLMSSPAAARGFRSPVSTCRTCSPWAVATRNRACRRSPARKSRARCPSWRSGPGTARERRRGRLDNGDWDFDANCTVRASACAIARQLLAAEFTTAVRGRKPAPVSLIFSGRTLVYRARHKDQKPENLLRIVENLTRLGSAVTTPVAR
jgi:hypothetical protein